MLVYCDGFDSYASGSDLTKKWQTVQPPWVWVAGAGRFGGGAVQSNGSVGGGKLARVLGILSNPTNTHGFWIKFSGPPAVATVFETRFNSTLVNLNMTLQLNTDGTISALGPITITSPTIWADNKWHWFEYKVFYNAGSAQYGFYVDGILQGNQIGGNAAGSPSTAGFISVAGITITIDDDLVYDDSAGVPTSTNWPLGARQISTLRPVSDGTCNFTVLSSGTTHFSLVNEINPDGDISYCEDGTSGHQDLFNMATLTTTPLGITAVVVNLFIETGVPGTINNEAVCKSGAVTTPSISVVTSNSYFTQQATYNTDPNTGVAWTLAGLSAAQFGYKNP